MGKNTKVMPQYPTIYLFSWEREGILTSQTLYIKLITSALSDLPPARNDLEKASTTHLKISQNMYIFTRISHLSSNRREQNSAHLFPVYDPSKKAHPQHEILVFLDAERHEFWKHHNYSSPWARELPKSNPERHEFQEHHIYLSPWARESPKSNPERHEFRKHHNYSSP